MLYDLVLFLAGAAGVFFFSTIVINEASRVARMMGKSLAAVGFLVLAVSTSLPELIVNVYTSVQGNALIGVGNVIGSNVANLCLVFGVAALLSGVRVSHDWLRTNAEILLFVSLAPLILLPEGIGGPVTGAVLLAAFALYSYYIVSREEETAVYYLHVPEKGMMKVRIGEEKRILPLVLFLAGVAGTILSSRLLAHQGIRIIGMLGVLPSAFGATVIAASTSLPEIVIDTRAIRKGMVGLAVGNIIGSCVINMSLVLGTTLVIGRTVSSAVLTPLLAMAMVPPVLLWYSFVKHEGVPREIGLMLLAYYALFLAREAVSIA